MALTLSQICAALLGGVFAWAAVAKALRPGAWLQALDRYDLSPPLRVPAAAGVPLGEAVVAGLLIVGHLQAGAALALALVAAFSLALARLGTQGQSRVPCGCFGRVTDRSLRLLLARNALLAALAAAVLAVKPQGWPSWQTRAPLGSDALPAALVLLGLVLCTWTGLRTIAALRGRRHT
ncbi:MAG: hypothetical protein M3454_08270 [Actinomycetota bacterium]|nr:hypothetical protein [Actinomycetota bacterium]